MLNFRQSLQENYEFYMIPLDENNIYLSISNPMKSLEEKIRMFAPDVCRNASLETCLVHLLSQFTE